MPTYRIRGKLANGNNLSALVEAETAVAALKMAHDAATKAGSAITQVAVRAPSKSEGGVKINAPRQRTAKK